MVQKMREWPLFNAWLYEGFLNHWLRFWLLIRLVITLLYTVPSLPSHWSESGTDVGRLAGWGSAPLTAVN